MNTKYANRTRRTLSVSVKFLLVSHDRRINTKAPITITSSKSNLTRPRTGILAGRWSKQLPLKKQVKLEGHNERPSGTKSLGAGE